jgi:hypothetical protein
MTLLLLAFLMLIDPVVEAAPVSQSFRYGDFSFTPPRGWEAMNLDDLKKPGTMRATRTGETLAAYSYASGKAVLVVSAAKEKTGDAHAMIRTIGDTLRSGGFSQIQYDDIRAANLVLPSLRAIDKDYVLIKSAIGLRNGTVMILDYLVLREAFNETAQAIQDSVISIRTK